VDEANLTGESMPVLKNVGDGLLSGSINIDGVVRYRVTQDFEGSNFNQILRLLEESLQHKPHLQTLANAISRYFSVTVLTLAFATFAWWYFGGYGFEKALVTAVFVIVIACPCALALATPIATLVGLGVAAKKGIIVKASNALESLAKADIALLDKTGTLTVGRPQVVFVQKLADFDERLVAALVSVSKHPVANGVVRYLDGVGFEGMQIEAQESAALGIVATIDSHRVVGGSPQLLKQEGVAVQTDALGTLFCVAVDSVLVAVYELQDEIRQESKEAVAALKKAGLKVVMLTGDRESVAAKVAKSLDIDEVHSQLSLQDKLAFVEKMQASGHTVLMVGDGLNDSLALARADIGIAMGGGADVSLHASDLALLNGSIASLSQAVLLAKKTFKTIRQNIFLSIAYNALTIPLAMAGYVIPLIAALSVSASSLLVCANSMRIKRDG
jgi:Cu+-exporting ATPase